MSMENNIDQLTYEHQSIFLCVLEALNFAQNAREIIIEETENANSGRKSEPILLMYYR